MPDKFVWNVYNFAWNILDSLKQDWMIMKSSPGSLDSHVKVYTTYTIKKLSKEKVDCTVQITVCSQRDTQELFPRHFLTHYL